MVGAVLEKLLEYKLQKKIGKIAIHVARVTHKNYIAALRATFRMIRMFVVARIVLCPHGAELALLSVFSVLY